jgi:hypothetical protein
MAVWWQVAAGCFEHLAVALIESLMCGVAKPSRGGFPLQPSRRPGYTKQAAAELAGSRLNGCPHLTISRPKGAPTDVGGQRFS